MVRVAASRRNPRGFPTRTGNSAVSTGCWHRVAASAILGLMSALTTIGLPVALGIIMFGLGLSLTVGDFARVLKQPKAVLIALICQLIVLPIICFGLVLAFQLPPILAVGMMMLAASPGGTTANLYSHLFRGDIALNISLTAVNSVIAVITLPLITNFAIWYFEPFDDQLGMQWAKA